jgi:apolipoprotein N-acyltransferase
MSVAATTLPIWRRSPLPIALAGSILMWAALPPLALGWLGWIAPMPWLLLVRIDSLPGRRPYRALYLAGLAFWLASIYWLILPHPLTSLGWLALSMYLAVYLPVFVGLSRVAVHRFSIPLWLAAPTVWTGLELARAHLLTGFLMASLAHTQVNWISLIQISDIFGEYGVDFVIMLTAACITAAFVNAQLKLAFRPAALVPAVIALILAVWYGQFQLANAADIASKFPSAKLRVALIQGNSLAEWKFDPARERQIMDDYLSLSQQAIAKAGEVGDRRPVDLVVWPETMFRTPLITFDPGFQPPPEATQSPDKVATYGPRDLAALVAKLNTPILVGIDRIHYPANAANEDAWPAVYNSAVLVGRGGKIVRTYDKQHRVMFGEYIPFANLLPFLYSLTPLTGGIEAGLEPAAFWLDGTYCFSPNICYETAIPHVIRRQVATLASRNEHPDALVNLTNDAWYWGSSELDMHLACDVFRAVETRVPMLVAANGGISAWIDHVGRVRAQSPKQTPDFILADLEPSGLNSWYVRYGDWFAGLCLACCAVLAFAGWRSRHVSKQTRRQGDKETRR